MSRVVWAGENTPAKVIEAYTEVVRPTTADAPEKGPEFAPVVAMVPDGSTLPETAQLQNVTYLKHGFDLRQLDLQIVQSIPRGATEDSDGQAGK